MSHPQSALAWMTCCLVSLAAGCSGCTERAQMDAGGRHEGTSESPTEMDAGERHEGISKSPKKMDAGKRHEGISGSRMTGDLVMRGRLIGQKDEANRYTAAVQVFAKAPPDWQHHPICVGVLVDPTLALTAAHCMCAPVRGESIRFDRSGCATKATVRFLDLVTNSQGQELLEDDIDGTISIHPQFQMELDAQGAVVTSLADLAVIRLERPVRPEIQSQPTRLATEEVEVGEVLSVVGFCYFDQGGGMDFEHRFTREKVQTPAGEDRFLFGPMDLASYKGDTGGPCLRETERGPELVGISQRGLGLTPTFTRIAPYRGWLEEQIRLASETILTRAGHRGER